MRMLLWLLAVLGWAWMVSPSPPPPTKSPDFSPENIFILAGQSNMAGRGGASTNRWDGFIPPQSQPNPSILRLTAGLYWEEAREPLHADISVNDTSGIGPGLAFANTVLDREPGFGVVGLVPCAVGGTSISQWARGTWLYNQTVRRAEVAREAGGTIRAILWFQGESDTGMMEVAKLYKQRMEKFISDVRADLQSPNLPLFQVAIASGDDVRFIKIVREAQLGIDLPNVVTIDAKGLPLESDNLHLTAESEVRVGEMLADAFVRTVLKSTPNSATRMYSNVISKFWMVKAFSSILVILT